LRNDCWPGETYGELTWPQGLAIFREQVPMSEKTYRTFRWGKDLQIWLVEGRDFRSPNTMPDGPEKTIWGVEQKAWFKRTIEESDAAFRVLISPTPLVGPDRDKKTDNHANAVFAHEGRELRAFIAGQKNTVVINGDRHWQYVSVDGETGLREFGTGPSSDQHAEGWDANDFRPEHRYLQLVGGFLHVTVDRAEGVPRMTLRHRGVTGEVYNEEVLVAE
jgi:alkaline phosphatase D